MKNLFLSLLLLSSGLLHAQTADIAKYPPAVASDSGVFLDGDVQGWAGHNHLVANSTLTPATASTLGGVKAGPSISVASDGTIGVKAGAAYGASCNVMDYGAVGGGLGTTAAAAGYTTGTLATKYPMLPGNITTADTMDQVAYEAAKASCAILGGGVVYLPANVYVMSQTSTGLPSGITDTPFGAASASGAISVVGDGSLHTYMYWPHDVGTANQYFALGCASRGTQGGCMGIIKGISLIGPSTTAYTQSTSNNRGTVYAHMSGIGWAPHRQIEDLSITGFYSGMSITGDQTALHNVTFFNNYYGMYWDVVTPGLAGDLKLDHFSIQNSGLAAIGVSNSSTIASTTFTKCFLGTSPFAVYKELGGSNNQVLYGTHWTNTQFENIGEAAFGDANTGTGTHNNGDSTIVDSVFSLCQFGGFNQTGTFSRNSHGPVAMFATSNEDGLLKIDGIENANLWTPGAKGMFDIGWPNGKIDITGDIDQLIYNVEHPASGMAASFTGTDVQVREEERAYRLHNTGDTHGPWNGQLATTDIVNNLAVHNMACGDWFSAFQCGGTTADFPFGFVTHIDSAGSYHSAIIITDGFAGGATAPSGVTDGSILKTAASGGIAITTSALDTSAPVIGIWDIDGYIILRPWR